ncbi:hypothetical protein BDV93DRAFT_507071 [Ceratobasidium sp. AG-I]|nr:hypothetical protein BDV93DRAFT_507071 [Ceratobasidium sp. AG-I]
MASPPAMMFRCYFVAAISNKGDLHGRSHLTYTLCLRSFGQLPFGLEPYCLSRAVLVTALPLADPASKSMIDEIGIADGLTSLYKLELWAEKKIIAALASNMTQQEVVHHTSPPSPNWPEMIYDDHDGLRPIHHPREEVAYQSSGNFYLNLARHMSRRWVQSAVIQSRSILPLGELQFSSSLTLLSYFPDCAESQQDIDNASGTSDISLVQAMNPEVQNTPPRLQPALVIADLHLEAPVEVPIPLMRWPPHMSRSLASLNPFLGLLVYVNLSYADGRLSYTVTTTHSLRLPPPAFSPHARCNPMRRPRRAIGDKENEPRVAGSPSVMNKSIWGVPNSKKS